jgi:nicotinate-nucleotide pyrophosphorylase (carboxylating)
VSAQEALDDQAPAPAEYDELVRLALAEDLAGGDDATTVATIAAAHRSRGRLVARAPGVVSGVPVAARVFELVTGGAAVVERCIADGTAVRPGDEVLVVSGPTRGLLTAERVALNFLGHLSGVATLTRRWVDAVAGTGAAIRDTRKTTPGMRRLEKWAVRCGGGVNHRMSLSDEALVKDNHIVAAGSIAAALAAVRAAYPGLACEVECDTLEQVAEAVAAGAEMILLDNMPPATLRDAVRIVAGRARTEASGGLTLDTARAVAETGVDYLSVGALTHSAPVLDIGLDLEES